VGWAVPTTILSAWLLQPPLHASTITPAGVGIHHRLTDGTSIDLLSSPSPSGLNHPPNRDQGLKTASCVGM
jgi:hypothetical protein